MKNEDLLIPMTERNRMNFEGLRKGFDKENYLETAIACFALASVILNRLDNGAFQIWNPHINEPEKIVVKKILKENEGKFKSRHRNSRGRENKNHDE